MCFCTSGSGSGPCVCPSLPDHQDSISSTKRYFDSLIACTNIFAQLSGFHVFFGAGSIHSQLIGDNMMVLLNLWSWKDENECRPEKSHKGQQTVELSWKFWGIWKLKLEIKLIHAESFQKMAIKVSAAQGRQWTSDKAETNREATQSEKFQGRNIFWQEINQKL